VRPRALQVLAALLFNACLLAFAGTLCAAAGELRGAAVTARTQTEAEGPKHAAIYKWINFVILVGGLGYLLRKPLREFFAGRSASLRKSLEEGRQALEKSEAQLRTVEEKLQRFEEEMAAFKTAARREMQAERELLRQATARETEKLLESLRAQMETASRQARVELKLYAAQQAVALAQQMVSERLDEASQQRLVRQFIAGLKTGRASN
jgi:F-type H+-transporting ATPase subunit b